ncbi:MAG: hypothetical protein U1G07_01515 [Verrucomicrobiota bacterium]
MSETASTTAFQPLPDSIGLTPILPTKPAASAPAAHACAGTAPSVALERNGDQISRIRIQCACGHVIELDCVY